MACCHSILPMSVRVIVFALLWSDDCPITSEVQSWNWIVRCKGKAISAVCSILPIGRAVKKDVQPCLVQYQWIISYLMTSVLIVNIDTVDQWNIKAVVSVWQPFSNHCSVFNVSKLQISTSHMFEADPKLISPGTKWPPCRRRYFQLHFLNENDAIPIHVSLKYFP